MNDNRNETPEVWYKRGIEARKAKNYAQAFQYFFKAAAQGHSESQRWLGLMYWNGEGTVKNYTEAFKWANRAAAQGNIAAATNVGYFYRNGIGVPKNDVLAAQWYGKAAANSDRVGQFNYAYMFYYGYGVKQDYNTAMKWFVQAANQRNQDAYYYIGHMYEKGYGVTKNLIEAENWFKKGAAEGHKVCLESLERLQAEKTETKTSTNTGGSVLKGAGEEWFKKGMDARVGKKYSEALQYFLKAAALGHVEAQSWLGWMYANGQGAVKNYNEAFKWTSKAAEKGHTGSAVNLGYFYRNGLGVTKSDAQALQWYRKAAEKGVSSGQFNYGFMFYYGYGVKKDYSEALRWFTKAADQNYKDAFSYLGEIYEKGYGVLKNHEKAISYYKKGADKGDDFCKKALKRIEASESADDWYYAGVEEEGRGNYEEAVRYYKKAAKANHIEALFDLACMFKNGKGVEQNKGTAAQFFLRAAKLGDSVSQDEIGDMHYNRKEYIEATEWYSKAARQGYAPSMFNLAWCFHHGGIAPADSVACNYNEAIRIYKECEAKAKDELKAQSQYQIGRCYEFGLNNISEARIWYQKAARAQYQPAKTALQQLEIVEKDISGPESWFNKGKAACWDVYRSTETIHGTTFNFTSYGWHGDQLRYSEAMRWWNKAAFYGHAESQYYLALYVYQRAHGSPVSETEALKWFTAAAKRGYRHAQAVLVNKYKYGDGAIKDLQESAKWQRILNQNN